MTLSVTQRPRARLDLLEQFVYLGEQAGVKTAERYFAAVQETCSLLASQSLSGTIYNSDIARLKGIRFFPVKEFENYLVFYLPTVSGIDVIRVLHGSRDIKRILAREES